jgi:hypothetical protein
MYRIFIILCLFLVLCSSQALSQKLDAVPVKKVISLELKEKPLKLVAEEIHKQTGYRIVFDEKWNELLLSGQYVGVTPEEFFLRALRKQNVSLSYDDKGNMIILRFFGDRDIGKIKAGAMVSESGINVQESKDVKALSEQQRQEAEKYLKDPESVDPISGMKLVDIQELHETQQAEREQLRKDPGTIDPVSGMTNAEIKNLHDVQQIEQEQLRENPESIDPLSGKTNAEIKNLHDVQHKELEQLKKPPVTEGPEKKEPKVM